MKDKGEKRSLFLLQKIGAGWVKTSELQIMNNYLELGSGLTAKEKARRKGMYMYRGDGYADAGEEADMGD